MRNLTNIFTVRRLLKHDMDMIVKTFEYLNNTYYNPVNIEFVEDVMLVGEFWGVFLKNQIIGITWIFPEDKKFFKNSNLDWNFKDLKSNIKDYLICGYVYCDKKYQDIEIYPLFIRLWKMKAKRYHKFKLLHYTQFKQWCDLDALFDMDFSLIAFRGIGNLTPHLIFISDTSFAKKEYDKKDSIKISISETKELSKFLEKGYIGIEKQQDEILLIKGDDYDEIQSFAKL